MCQEVECQREVRAQGLCHMHYQRARRRGEIQIESAYGAGLDFLRALPETDECIEWPFGRFSTGYGNVKVDRRNRTAHSVSYEMNVGPIPPKYDVCHGCGNRPCVNPRHLRADTHVANMADKLAQGTHHKGERNPRAKITAAQAVSIRDRVTSGERQIDVARSLGVNPQIVNAVVKGRTWADEIRRVTD
jgi:hypothetical protein